MANAVLPSLLIFAIKRKSVHDELIYLVKGDLSIRCFAYGHRDQRDVGVRRLDEPRILASVYRSRGRIEVWFVGSPERRVVEHIVQMHSEEDFGRVCKGKDK